MPALEYWGPRVEQDGMFFTFYKPPKMSSTTCLPKFASDKVSSSTVFLTGRSFRLLDLQSCFNPTIIVQDEGHQSRGPGAADAIRGGPEYASLRLLPARSRAKRPSRIPRGPFHAAPTSNCRRQLLQYHDGPSQPQSCNAIQLYELPVCPRQEQLLDGGHVFQGSQWLLSSCSTSGQRRASGDAGMF